MRENTRADITLAAGGRSTFLTYEPYYGLKEKPFSLSADPRFLYKSQAHAPTFEALRAGIRRREGLIVLTGEPGTGKTTLCRGVLEALDRKTFCTLVPDPFVSREDLLKMLLLDFGVMSVEDLKGGRLQGLSRPELSYPLYEFLKSLVPLQAYAVMIIDEAQNLSSQLLEEIRILSDLEAPEKLLQLVLVGQPELRAKLKDYSMRQVDQRVSVRVELTGLDRPGVGEYIAHRLNVAGGGTDRVTFSDDAVDAVFKATKGNPRLINLSCDKALHHGHLARTFTIGPELVTRSLAELGMADPVQSAVAPAPASARAAAPPEPTDDFGLGEKFFERERPRPVGDDDIPPVVETTAPQFLLGGTSDEAPPSSKRRTILLLFLCILAPVLVAWLIWTWQQQPSEGSALPSLPIPANEDAAVMAKPVATEAAPVGQSPTPTTGQIVPADAVSQPYEVGVALFAGYDRANRLAVALAASGFRAITRPIESSRGRMYQSANRPLRVARGS